MDLNLISALSLAPDRSKYNVLIAHPGTQHSYQAALAFQESGSLQCYMTGFYYKTSGVLARLIKLLPLEYANKLERQLLRRRNDEIDERLIRTYPLLELIYIFFAQSRVIRRWSGQVLRWRNRKFNEAVARLVKAARPSAVICYDSCALATLEACRGTGSLAILDQSVGHLASGIKILREEAELHPEFADSLSIDIPEWLVEQCTAEALAADKILVASEYVRCTLIESGVSSSRIIILPYGVDVSRFCPGTRHDDGTFRVLFVGGISQRKGIKYLLEAFKQINLPNAELTLVGGDACLNALEPYEGIFRHVPHVPYREVHTVFQSADIFVYPSLHEGSALAIYEALASGLPVITTPNAGSVVRDGVDGFVVPIRDIDALKEKIMVLYQNKELRKKMGVQARRRAESFTWQAYRQKLGVIVREVIEEERSPRMRGD